MRHIFAAKISPTCANYALKRNAIDNETMFPDAARSVKTTFYMEYYLESIPTVEDATRKVHDFVKMLARCGTLSKILNNVRGVLSTLNHGKSYQW